ncbi:unnamed protein product [Polarella glacialis]|uniref:Uncharacterized protein n=1 Tax=Polarella glacialis TaxID=89957 RepID=A0A813DYN8_POLGL|nr:unnamed protein product [Polarella glacialis]
MAQDSSSKNRTQVVPAFLPSKKEALSMNDSLLLRALEKNGMVHLDEPELAASSVEAASDKYTFFLLFQAASAAQARGQREHVDYRESSLRSVQWKIGDAESTKSIKVLSPDSQKPLWKSISVATLTTEAFDWLNAIAVPDFVLDRQLPTSAEEEGNVRANLAQPFEKAASFTAQDGVVVVAVVVLISLYDDCRVLCLACLYVCLLIGSIC